MKNYILFLMLLTTLSSYCQFTLIPDNNFEQALINLGLDDVLDGQVLTANINPVTELFIESRAIEDLTGIQDFEMLSELFAVNNLLTALDISQNTNLELVVIDFNPVTSIDISNNLNLFSFSANYTDLVSIDTSMNIDLEMLQVEYCNISNLDLSNNINLGLLVASGNQLTSIDLSNNTFLEEVYLYENQLTEINLENLPNLLDLFIDVNLLVELDLSNNPLLEELVCSYNPNLSFINIKNGENEIIEIFAAEEIATNACIQVDDAQAATNASTFPYNQWEVDATAIFSEDCSLSLNNISTSNFVFYPNPIEDYLFIQDISIVGYNIYEVTGKLVESDKMTEKYINLKHLKKGVYLIEFIIDENQKIVKKVVKQ